MKVMIIADDSELLQSWTVVEKVPDNIKAKIDAADKEQLGQPGPTTDAQMFTEIDEFFTNHLVIEDLESYDESEVEEQVLRYWKAGRR